MRANDFTRTMLHTAAGLLVCLASGVGRAQRAAAPPRRPSLSDTVRQLAEQVQQLQAAVLEIKQESELYRTETQQLKEELESTRQKLEAGNHSAESQNLTQAASQDNLEQRTSKLEEDQSLLESRVAEQYQTKIESASKYRVRLSGLLLFNLFSNNGNVDHLEVPGVVVPANPQLAGYNSGGSLGGSFRQSQLGLEVYGPTFAGAKTRGDFVADFFGEFPETVNGSAGGSLRLRTGTIRLDWDRTSLVGGMDSIFFSPTYPTSFASLGIPALSYSGNLWAWMPQIRIEHRLISSDATTVTLSAGIYDPLTGEAPPNEFLRIPGAGESARQPGYGTRLEWSHKVAGQDLTLAIGGAYNRENWGFNRYVNGWVTNTDWNVPLGSLFQLSGKFYTGQAIGGFGAGVGRSIVFNVPATCLTPSTPLSCQQTEVKGLHATGGWAQLKFKPATRFEINTAGGQDGANSDDIRAFNPVLAPGYIAANITRNRSEFVNFIYRPKSNLLFSTEFRTLRTFIIDGTSLRANQVNLAMGVFF